MSRLFPDDPHGHLQELRTDPIGLLHRVRDECGDIGSFRLADRDVVMVSGAEANEQFFRAPDSTLDQAAAYPFMTPIFGKGVVFDATPEERQQMLKNQALRGDMMRGHAATIEAEINRMVADWGDEGEIDLLDWFAELTIYTTSACLIGLPFREELDCLVRALLPRAGAGHRCHRLRRRVRRHRVLPPSRRRARAAGRAGAGDHRQAQGASRDTVPREERDLLDVLISIDMTADYITGIFISMMFAGHHTSSGTAAWTMIELMRHPDVTADIVSELDELYADGAEVSFQALRSIPRLEAALKETLRLHPPLIILLRLVAGGDRARPATRSRPARWWRPRLRVSNRIADGLPRAGDVRPGPLPRPAAGGPRQPVDLDPLRRRPAPLRGQRVRDDAAQGDLLGAAARLGVRDGAAERVLPRRLLEDGDPARAAVPGEVSASVSLGG